MRVVRPGRLNRGGPGTDDCWVTTLLRTPARLLLRVVLLALGGALAWVGVVLLQRHPELLDVRPGGIVLAGQVAEWSVALGAAAALLGAALGSHPLLRCPSREPGRA